MKHIIWIGLLLLTTNQSVWCQDDGYQQLPLDDMSAFQSQAGNWRIVGDIFMDPRISVEELHHEAETGKRKKKRKKKKEAPKPQAVRYSSGTGVLLNLNNDQMKDALLTDWEHSDIDLSLEVMLPKGSNSGIYLQGRYEVQLFDSWGVRNPKFSDIGGIYRNWESEPGKIYMGKAPLSNPCKAPGLWQQLEISFRAPKFDQGGNKIANAKLVYVDLNGVRIHENVEIPLPTGGPIENNEKPAGPLMIQGDHGPVAFRNIKYRILENSKVKLSEVQYQVFHGSFKNMEGLKDQEPAFVGTSQELTCSVAGVPDKFAIVYAGNIEIPEKGDYQFELAYTGGAYLTIDGEEVINFQRPDGWWRRDQSSVNLESGTHRLELTYFKEAEWMPPRLALSVSNSRSYPLNLHAFDSYPPKEDPVSDILVNSSHEVRLLRAFLDYGGDKNQRLTHTIGVGEPTGLNYVYDLARANLVCVWRGNFVDATPMWHDRGDGSFRPLGAAQYIMNAQPFFTNNEDFSQELRTSGYQLEESGRPIFTYQLGPYQIKDRIYPHESQNYITRQVTLAEPAPGLFMKLAQGTDIISMGDGRYAIGDKEFYVEIHQGNTEIRELPSKKELIAPLNDQSLVYSIIW